MSPLRRQVVDLDESKPVRRILFRLVTVLGRHEEGLSTGLGRGDQLVPDAADRTDLAVGVDGARSGYELSAVELPPRSQLVDQGQCEHQSGRRTADVGEIELHGEGNVRDLAGCDAEVTRFGLVGPRPPDGDRHNGLHTLTKDGDVDRGAGRDRTDRVLNAGDGGYRSVADLDQDVAFLQGTAAGPSGVTFETVSATGLPRKCSAANSALSSDCWKSAVLAC